MNSKDLTIIAQVAGLGTPEDRFVGRRRAGLVR